jgi:protein-S-isoprenylcysteine O-methyltransferase Ste14
MLQIKKTKFLPPYGVLASMAVMYLLSMFFPIFTWQNTQFISYLLLASSFLCILYCAYVFHKNKTEIKPFKESSFLILSWPYTISRNPIYICMIVFLFGWGLLLQSISAFIVIPVFALWIHNKFVLQEEIMLEDTFSSDYLAYKNRVRRWI